MSDAPINDDDALLAGSSVFRKPPARAWAVSFAAHAAAFVALGVVGTFIGVKAGVIPPTIIELDAPPPRRPPPAAPPPPRAAAPSAAAPRPGPARPAARAASRPGRPGRAAAPHVLAAVGNGPGAGDEMPVGDNNDFAGGVVGNGGGAAPVTPAPEPEPEAPVHAATGRRGPVQIPEEAVAPVALDRPMPAYPDAARRSGVQAEVVARLVVDEDGTVSAVEILRGHPDFDALVREALRHWRFSPATVDGRALAVYQIVRVPFRLENL
jgi:protein TonB